MVPDRAAKGLKISLQNKIRSIGINGLQIKTPIKTLFKTLFCYALMEASMAFTRKKLPGRIYRKSNKRADGTVIEHSTWTVRYKGKDYATGETDLKSAEKYLFNLAAGIDPKAAPVNLWSKGLVAEAVAPPPAGALMSEVLDLFIADSDRRELASAGGNRGIVENYLRPFFGKIPAAALTTNLFNKYRDSRFASTVRPSNATVNREMAALKRALNYAMKEQDPPLLLRYPKIVMLKESDPRKGFLAHRDYTRLRHALPDYWEPVFVTAYHVGRRRGELLQIEMADVFLDAAEPHIRVYGDTTKNGEPSLIPVYGDMVIMLRAQIETTRREHPECRLLFHKNGKSIQKNQTFYDEWNRACEVAGVPGLLGHDLRRTACKMLIDAGNSRKDAMQITGHKTESAFNRYHIVDQASMTRTVGKAEAFLAQQTAALLEAKPSGLVS